MKTLYVEWVDSHGCTPSWVGLEGYAATLPVMKSIGWVVYENDDLISICGNIGEETENTLSQGNGIMTIPKRCIICTKEICLS